MNDIINYVYSHTFSWQFALITFSLFTLCVFALLGGLCMAEDDHKKEKVSITRKIALLFLVVIFIVTAFGVTRLLQLDTDEKDNKRLFYQNKEILYLIKHEPGLLEKQIEQELLEKIESLKKLGQVYDEKTNTFVPRVCD
jgi:hypothetical protein